MVLEAYIKLYMIQPDFLEINFLCQNRKCENGPKMGQKQGFLNLLKTFVINFYWICSIMKIYIIYCVSAQTLYLGKCLFPRYGQKCSQPIRLQDFLMNHISRTDQWNSLIFLHIDTNSNKLKVNHKIFRWAWSKMHVTSVVIWL